MILADDVEMVHDPVPQRNALGDMTKYEALDSVCWQTIDDNLGTVMSCYPFSQIFNGWSFYDFYLGVCGLLTTQQITRTYGPTSSSRLRLLQNTVRDTSFEFV